MEKEFKSLSEKVQCRFSSCRPARGEKCWHGSEPCEWVYPEEDIREFIKRLKEEIDYFKKMLMEDRDYDVLKARIDKLAGDKLI